ncbi:hypothetical protein [Caenimonas sp. SL110]|uniref:hypothetical protein n=1 Tax=Caenimonas sp. SL110 TaxID=1450524 RepID=UPI0006542E23|nr:hypothetical protein [Caenimonas sp. SL110]
MEQDPFDAIRYVIAEDKKAVTLTVPDIKLDAAQFDQLLLSLAVLRAGLEPAHPDQPPGIDEWVYHPMDAWQLLPRADSKGTPAEDGFLLVMRSPGMGWCQLQVPAADAQAMVTYLQTPRVPKADI